VRDLGGAARDLGGAATDLGGTVGRCRRMEALLCGEEEYREDKEENGGGPPKYTRRT
jgi:hypothetical protein